MSAPTLRPPLFADPTRAIVLTLYVDGAAKVFVVSERATVGRKPTASIAIPHTSVSREHASFVREGEELFVVDLGSTNGTWINGERCVPNMPTPVGPGCALRFGHIHAELTTDAGRVALDTEPPVGDDLVGSALRPAEDFVAEDPKIGDVLARIRMIATSDLSLLLSGETGVGKERVAEQVHAWSPRAGHPFVKINCAAIPESILESELFGYERGAFTGANTPKQGLLEAADRGTLFLDEVGELPLPAQAKLLRVLETREVTRLGSVKPKKIDVRILSATNRDLRYAIKAGIFRSDLFYRLQGLQLTIPPLRDRPGDIAALARRFVLRATEKAGRPHVQLSPAAIEKLLAYPWPGNVRELRNVIERSLVMIKGNTLETDDIDLGLADDDESVFGADEAHTRATASGVEPVASARDFDSSGEHTVMSGTLGATTRKAVLEAQMVEVEKQRVVEALAQAGGNQTRAAKLLGVSRGTLIARIEAFGLARPRKAHHE